MDVRGPEQLRLVPEFDAEKAKALGEAGMAQADGADRNQIYRQAMNTVIAAWPRGSALTADDIVREIGETPSEGANQNNIIGAVFSSSAKRGLIVWTGRYVKSERTSRHGNQIRVWVRK